MSDEQLPEPPTPRPARRLPRWMSRTLRCIQWTVNILVVLALLLVLTPAGDWLCRWRVVADPLAKADYLIVPGGDVRRLIEAARLYHQGWAKRVIISSTPKGTARYAEVARMCGIPDEALLLDFQAARTADHPPNIAAMEGVDKADDRFIVVTSAAHTYRCRECFAAGGYRHVALRAPGWETEGLAGNVQWYVLTHAVPAKLYELGAWIYYRLRGWM